MSTTTGPRASVPGRDSRADGSAGGRAGGRRHPDAPRWRVSAAGGASGTKPPELLSAPAVVPQLRADCTADGAGGLTFDVGLPAPGAGESGDAALLLRRRRGAPAPVPGAGPGDGTLTAVDVVRLPATPVGPAGTLRAVLPSIMTLPEGRWDVYLALGDAEPRRLVPGINDLRSLVGRTPRAGRTWLGVRIPYATRHGNLTVRSWLRWPHAEAGELRVEDGGMTLQGRLYGAQFAPGARIEVRPRQARGGTAGRTVSAAVDNPGDDSGPGVLFAAGLPYAELAEAAVWDVWLRPAPDAEPVRVARILDDVPDKKHIFTYPSRQVATAGGERVVVRPYYTLANDLALQVEGAAGE